MNRPRSPHEETSDDSVVRKKRALGLAIGLSLLAFIGQLVGAYFTGSLALLGDTAHLFTDLFSLTVSLIAVTLSTRPATELRSFGLYRLEVLATFLNGILLVLVALSLSWEAVERLQEPAPVLALPLMAIAAGGLLVNLLAAYLLSRALRGEATVHAHSHGHGAGHDHDHQHDHGHAHGDGDRNIRGAMLHVLSDALGSVAVVIGALITYLTDWLWVDPALALVLALVILRWSWRLLMDAGHVLLEGTPSHLSVTKIAAAMRGLDQRVLAVEDLHVWEITSRMYAATAEVRVRCDSLAEAEALRIQLQDRLERDFGIGHTVLALRP